MRQVLIAFFALMATSMSGAASAATFIYSQTVIGSGSLGGIQFTDAEISFSASGDPANVFDPSLSLSVLSAPVYVTVAGIGSGQFLDQTIVAQNRQNGAFGFGNTTRNLAIFFTGIGSVTYDLRTVLAPVTGDPSFNVGTAFNTTAGSFQLVGAGRSTASVSQAAVAVPEPATWIIMVMGMAAVGHGMRRSRRTLAVANAPNKAA